MVPPTETNTGRWFITCFVSISIRLPSTKVYLIVKVCPPLYLNVLYGLGLYDLQRKTSGLSHERADLSVVLGPISYSPT